MTQRQQISSWSAQIVNFPNQESTNWVKITSINSTNQTETREPVFENDRSDREEFGTSIRSGIVENLKILGRLRLTRVRIRTVQDFQTFRGSGPPVVPRFFAGRFVILKNWSANLSLFIGFYGRLAILARSVDFWFGQSIIYGGQLNIYYVNLCLFIEIYGRHKT